MPPVRVTIENVCPTNDGRSNRNLPSFRTLKALFCISPSEIPYRIMSSLVPPIKGTFSTIHADLICPLIVIVLLNIILYMGLISKGVSSAVSISFYLSFGYWSCISIVTIALSILCRSRLTKTQMVSICGYSLSGHVIALLLASFYSSTDPSSHSGFFLLTAVFGGLSVIRFAIILLTRTPKPAHRLLLCALPCTVHLLHLIYCYFVCIHRSSKFSFPKFLD